MQSKEEGREIRAGPKRKDSGGPSAALRGHQFPPAEPRGQPPPSLLLFSLISLGLQPRPGSVSAVNWSQ